MTKNPTKDSKNKELQAEQHPLSEIKRTIAVVSGKGGVGKSMVTALLAVYLQRRGNYRVGVLDADITGPSMPRLFGAEDFKPKATDEGMFPVRTHSNIQLMSINLLLENPEDPVVWRGPILGNVVKQFWTDVIWGDLDFLLLDMPPGTGDVPLTVFQSIPLDAVLIVASPQDLVSMVVKKAIRMAQIMDVPILGLIENMSYMVCPECHETINLFGIGHSEETARQYSIPFSGRLPLDPLLAQLGDQGHIERIHKNYLEEVVAAIEQLPEHGSRRHETDEIKGGKPMNVAIVVDGDFVAAHFGHCEGFKLFEISDGLPVGQRYLANPGHKPGLLPELLGQEGVHVVIAGGMGGGAMDLFNEKSIVVFTGASGTIEEVLDQYLAGTLVSDRIICQEHQHADSCGGHN